jgi:RHS repeat-associated protein
MSERSSRSRRVRMALLVALVAGPQLVVPQGDARGTASPWSASARVSSASSAFSTQSVPGDLVPVTGPGATSPTAADVPPPDADWYTQLEAPMATPTSDDRPRSGSSSGSPSSAPRPPAERGDFDPETSVEVVSERTEFGRIFENADGTSTLELSPVPLHFDDGGHWEEVDNRLVMGPDGVIRNAANSWTVEFDRLGVSDSIAVTADPGTVEWSPRHAARVKPVIEPDGVSVRYPEVWPGVDLVYRVSATGVEEFIEIKRPGTRAEFPFEVSGAELEMDDDGGVEFVGEWDEQGAYLSAPRMLGEDEAVNDAAAQPTISLTDTGSTTQLDLTVDEAWLESLPETTFPVVVDPSFWVGRSRMESYKFNLNNCARTATRTDLALAGNPNQTSTSPERWHSVAYFDYSGILGTRVTNAELWTEMWEGNLSYPINVYWAAGWGQHCGVDPIGGWGNLKGSFGTGSWWPEQRQAPGLRDQYDSWTRNSQAGGALLFAGDNSYGRYTLKGFEPRLLLTYNSPPPVPGSGTTTSGGHDRSLRLAVPGVGDPDGDGVQYAFQIVEGSSIIPWSSGWQSASSWSTTLPEWAYNRSFRWRVGVRDGLNAERWSDYLGSFSFPNAAPARPVLVAPATGTAVTSTTPTLVASSSDADGDPVSFYFYVCRPGQSTGCVESGRVGGSWTVPAGRLDWSQTYVWYAFAADPFVVSPQSAGSSFVAAVPTTTPEWTLGVNPFGLMAGPVDSSNGNLVLQAPDAQVVSAGPALTIARSYNSLDGRLGAFGEGWSSFLDTSVVEDANGVTVLRSNGRREFHGRNADGTFQAFGYATELAKLPTGFRYIDAGRVRYLFDAGGALTEIVDPNGRALRVGSRVGDRQRLTDVVSGRSLELFWSSPAGAQREHVVAVETTAAVVDGRPLRWVYGYDGDRLVDVCQVVAPDGAAGDVCTGYGYDDAGRLSSVVDASGDTSLLVSYDEEGRVATASDAVGATWGLLYTEVVADGEELQRTTVTDPRGFVSTADYDDLRKVRRATQPGSIAGVARYDEFGYLAQETRRLGTVAQVPGQSGAESTVSYVNDAAGNVLQRIDEAGATWTFTYNGERQILTATDPLGHTTSYAYDATGFNRVSVTSPATGQHAAPVRSWTLSDGTAPVDTRFGGGVVPRGVPIAETDERGGVRRLRHDARGDLREVEEASGAITRYEYDPLGRLMVERRVVDGVEMTFRTLELDERGRVAREVGPEIANEVTGQAERREIVNEFDLDDNLVSSSVRRLGTPGRTTRYEYDAANRLVATVDPLGGRTSLVLDPNGNVVRSTDALGRVVETSFDGRNRPTEVIERSVIDDPFGAAPVRNVRVVRDISYDVGDRRVSETDALGFVTQTTYDPVGRVVSVRRSLDAGALSWRVLEENDYDLAGRLVSRREGDGRRAERFELDALGRVVVAQLLGPAAGAASPRPVDTLTEFVFDVSGNVLSERRSRFGGAASIEETRYVYDLAGREIERTVENGSTDLSTSATYDEWGRAVSRTDANGNTTDVEYDVLGRVTRTIAPPVGIEVSGRPASTGRPTTVHGYDAFGDLTHERDARGQDTVSSYDAMGRRVTRSWPAYTPPGSTTVIRPVERWTFDAVGNLVTATDTRGAVTTYSYDSRDRLVRVADPPARAGIVAGVSTMRYDDLGRLTESVNQVGARTTYSYDAFGRPVAVTEWVTTTPGVVVPLTSRRTYDALGNVVTESSPMGATRTFEYSARGEVTRATDADGASSILGYDVAGRLVLATDPLGRTTSTVYDPAGRPVRVEQRSSGGTLLRATEAVFDPNGNRIRSTDARGSVTVFEYDALDRLTAASYPTSAGSVISTSFGYDEAGNLTRTTDGRGNATFSTYNSWGLLETTVEPSTASHPSTSSRTWITAYDAGGLPTKETQPGGVVVTRTFDALRRVTTAVANGGGTVRATDTFGYDLLGRLTRVSHPVSAINVRYDERNLPVGTSGGAGTSTLVYDDDGRLVRRTDKAGTTTFGWDPVGRLTTLVDPLTKTTLHYSWDAAGQLDDIRYGDVNPVVRDVSWDQLGRLVGDRIAGPTGTVLYDASYTYDANDNLATETVGPAGIVGGGTHLYAYDLADRLVSWAAPNGARTDYGWDAAGNRTAVGTTTFTFDARNRLTSSSAGSTYTWTARGALLSAKEAGRTTSYVHDGFNRQTKAGTTVYAYDGLGRMAKRGTTSFTYAGLLSQPASEGSTVTARTPDGSVVAARLAPTAALLASDRHGDVIAAFTAAGVVTGTQSFDPFGTRTAGVGKIVGNLGFQGHWTDPTTKAVNMGARWYRPNVGAFGVRDDIAPVLTSSTGLNLYLYGNASPLGHVDPDGHQALRVVDTPSNAGVLSVAAIAPSRPLRVSDAPTYTGTLAVGSSSTARWIGGGGLQPAVGAAVLQPAVGVSRLQPAAGAAVLQPAVTLPAFQPAMFIGGGTGGLIAPSTSWSFDGSSTLGTCADCVATGLGDAALRVLLEPTEAEGNTLDALGAVFDGREIATEMLTTEVSGYVKKSGTVVDGYDRARRGWKTTRDWLKRFDPPSVSLGPVSVGPLEVIDFAQYPAKYRDLRDPNAGIATKVDAVSHMVLTPVGMIPAATPYVAAWQVGSEIGEQWSNAAQKGWDDCWPNCSNWHAFGLGFVNTWLNGKEVVSTPDPCREPGAACF